MQIHLSIYHPKHAGILTAAVELNADQVILLRRDEDGISGLKASVQARGIKGTNESITFNTQLKQSESHLYQFIDQSTIY